MNDGMRSAGPPLMLDPMQVAFFSLYFVSSNDQSNLQTNTVDLLDTSYFNRVHHAAVSALAPSRAWKAVIQASIRQYIFIRLR